MTTQNITLTPAGGSAVAGTVAYDSATTSVTLTPSAPLLAGTVYTATLPAGGIRSSLGTPLASTVTWSFTTMDCPCQLMPSTLTPASTGNPVRDGRGGTGPWTYELGTSFTVDQAMKLTAVRFYKSPGETGTHVGRVWSSAGTQLAQVTYAGETASGWQQQALASPITLTAGQTYVVVRRPERVLLVHRARPADGEVERPAAQHRRQQRPLRQRRGHVPDDARTTSRTTSPTWSSPRRREARRRRRSSRRRR